METPASLAVTTWLAEFESSLQSNDVQRLAACLADGCHHRDLLVFDWTFHPEIGAEAIAARLCKAQPGVAARDFAVPAGRIPPSQVPRHGAEMYEAIFEFRTAVGRASGVVRLPVSDPTRASVLMTTLEEIAGHEERIDDRRPRGVNDTDQFGGPNWLDRRTREQQYDDREPTVLIVGGGQGGLALGARLRQVGVDTLVVEQLPRIGDNWRRRYHSLVLHNPVYSNHLPYMPFPPNWPKYIPKDKLADWLEYYAEAMELNCWVGTEFVGAQYSDDDARWTVELRREGVDRRIRPRHLVFANGVSGIPFIPELPGLESFEGELVHSEAFVSGEGWAGKTALVVGTGSSGHDVAQDLHCHGATTTIVQRGSTTVASVEPTGALDSALYATGLPTEDVDLITSASTYPLAVSAAQAAVKMAKEFDRELLAGLDAVGFKYDYGDDDTGHRMKARRYGGGYYLNVGCSELIASRDIELLQYEQIERFVPEGVMLDDGSTRPLDLVVLATGYHSQQELVRRTLGSEVADRIGQIYGVGPDGEQANIWKRTEQPGLWFTGGTLLHARVYSRHLALQILASELGYI